MASQDFASRIDTVITDVVNAGRKSFGPTFQLYMNTYVPFFNETDEGCDTISYTWYFPFHDYDLTRAKRARLNKLTDALNGQIKAAVDRRSNQGVFLVTGYQDAYVGHQFCDPRAGDLNKPIENSVWFWHSKRFVDRLPPPCFHLPKNFHTEHLIYPVPGTILKARISFPTLALQINPLPLETGITSSAWTTFSSKP